MESEIYGYGGESVEGGETQERGKNSVGVRGLGVGVGGVYL